MSKIIKKEIYIYAHWQGMIEPLYMGLLTATHIRGKEVFSFEYSQNWLQSGYSQILDPDLQFYSGPQYPRDEKPNFGLFLDSSPDRWGELLMERREAFYARNEKRPVRTLFGSDFLLGVYDGHRMGALRFKTIPEGPFLDDHSLLASPPWTLLRELEQASLNFEEDNWDAPDYQKWINMLIAPGSSLGGARPKASVLDPQGALWIAKFPSRQDKKDVGAWEMVVNDLAQMAGLNVAKVKLEKFNSQYHTYLTRRFDRTNAGERIHFASAMTLLGYSDGEKSAGVSYLELVAFINRFSAAAQDDRLELWKRVVFNIFVKNTDDHLRNHGFLLTGKGWRLSPAYDLNPNETGTGLHLNISETDNSLNPELAIEVAPLFGIEESLANEILNNIREKVSGWRSIASGYGISRSEQERMRSAFELAESV